MNSLSVIVRAVLYTTDDIGTLESVLPLWHMGKSCTCVLQNLVYDLRISFQEIRERILAEESPSVLEQRRTAGSYEHSRNRNLMLSPKTGIPAKQITLPVSVSVSAIEMGLGRKEGREGEGIPIGRGTGGI